MGVDVGGTFTDVCVITPDGRTVRAKVLTDTKDQSIGVKTGVDQVKKILKDQEGWEGQFEYVWICSKRLSR